jgi:cytidine deaminase
MSMRKIDLSLTVTEYDSVDELSQQEKMLISKAEEIRNAAYAPYSNFSVGAAVLLSNDTIVSGNNQENAAYPLGLCAERVALFAAGANHAGIPVKAIAISASSSEFCVDKPVTPCGACRQVIAEYEHRYNHPIRLLMKGESGKIIVAENISQFLPWMFNAGDLQRK